MNKYQSTTTAHDSNKKKLKEIGKIDTFNTQIVPVHSPDLIQSLRNLQKTQYTGIL